MRKVLLNMNEQQKYEIIKSLVEHNGNKDRAALKLGCTKRHVSRRFKNTNHMAKLPSSMATRDASLHTPFLMQRKKKSLLYTTTNTGMLLFLMPASS